MVNKDYQDQHHTLKYIESEYMPWIHQWAKSYIDRNRNWGQRTNSPTETAHRFLKSFLVVGTGHLLHLHNAIVQMIETKKRQYDERSADSGIRQALKYQGKEWLGDLLLKITIKALDLIGEHGKIARAALANEEGANRPCRETFTHQYGLPCSHRIAKGMEDNSRLALEEVHARWWLWKPRVSHQRLYLILTNSY